jgi:uracil-DNA glycosylase
MMKKIAPTFDISALTESKHASLAELVDEMEHLRDDPLANAGTNMVISRGNPKARLLIIGEAPGSEENRQGKPFVGSSGKLLDKILQAAGFDPEQDVFITNSVFRMPPGAAGKVFRKPTLAEIDYYRPYVFTIIRLINPLIILLTGNVACQSVLGQTGITTLRGKWIHLQDYWIMPIFHPSYLLRNPARGPGSPQAQMQADIRKVRKKYDELIEK